MGWFLLFGLAPLLRNKMDARYTNTTKAIILEKLELKKIHESENGGQVYNSGIRIQFEYQVSGDTQRSWDVVSYRLFKKKNWWWLKNLKVGDTIPIRYKSTQKNEAIVDTKQALIGTKPLDFELKSCNQANYVQELSHDL